MGYFIDADIFDIFCMNKIATSINAGENTLINQPCKIIHNCLSKSIHIHLFKLHKYYFSHLYCLSTNLDSQNYFYYNYTFEDEFGL